MIKANELRIGNYVEHYHFIAPVVALWPDIVSIGSPINNNVVLNVQRVGQTKVENVQPIELTAEWLSKFGFERGWYGLEVDDFSVSEYDEGYFYFGYGIKQGKPLKYVHELQNLFFSLIGEELTIKEPALNG
jgi:hypothetical protein